MRTVLGIGASLLAAAGAHAQLWNTGGFDGLDGRASDHPSMPVRPDTRAADDFVLPPGNGRVYTITGIRGRALAKNYTSAVAELYYDQSGVPSATPFYTFPQSTLNVLQTGVFGQYDLIDLTFAANQVALAPGRYWLSIVCNVSGAPAPNDGYGFFATAGNGTVQGLQGMFRTGNGAWAPISNARPDGPTDFSFRIDGSQQQQPPSNCYPNCDNSTVAPVLNVNDYICFLSRFIAGETYANCDHSTTPPVLNLLDFICFQQKFAAGCSS